MENDIDPLYPFRREWERQQAEPMPVFAKKRGRGSIFGDAEPSPLVRDRVTNESTKNEEKVK
jgi:hypothetical protein